MEVESRDLTKENLINMINNLDLGQVSEVKFRNYIETISESSNQLLVEEICTITVRHNLQVINKETTFTKLKGEKKCKNTGVLNNTKSTKKKTKEKANMEQ